MQKSCSSTHYCIQHLPTKKQMKLLFQAMRTIDVVRFEYKSNFQGKNKNRKRFSFFHIEIITF